VRGAAAIWQLTEALQTCSPGAGTGRTWPLATLPAVLRYVGMASTTLAVDFGWQAIEAEAAFPDKSCVFDLCALLAPHHDQHRHVQNLASTEDITSGHHKERGTRDYQRRAEIREQADEQARPNGGPCGDAHCCKRGRCRAC